MKAFKVLLIYPNLQMVNLLPTNIAVLAAYLKANGIDVRVFDTTLYRTAEKSVDDLRVEHLQLRPFNLKEKGVDYKTTDMYGDFREVFAAYAPDLIAVSATDDTYALGMSLVAAIKGRGVPVVVGGVHPTFAPEEVIADGDVDMICLGEGEKALLELCQALRDGRDICRIKNIWVKKEGAVHKNPLREPVDIADLPYDDFSVFERQRLFRPMQGKVYAMVPVTIDRGCPFACAFCAAPTQNALYSAATGMRYFRVKPVKRIMDEIEHQVRVSGAGYIYFNSETFFSRPEEELEEFARSYADRVALPFWCQTRIETITEKRVRMLRDMRCDRISVGIEHGNEEFRKKVLKKHFTNEQVIEAFTILEGSGIPVTVNNIIGFPDETRELAFDTIRLNRRIRADSINAYFFTPYHGTPLRRYAIEKGYLAPRARTDSLMRGSVLTMPQFTADEIRGLVRTFPLYVKMPESYSGRIRVAERFDSEGEAAFAELRSVYFREHFR